MLMLKSKELREKRAKLIADSRELLKTDALTAEIRTQVEAMDKDIDAVTADIALYEKQETRERELAVTTKAPITKTGSEGDAEARKAQQTAAEKRYSDTFFKYMAVGVGELSAEERNILRTGFVKTDDTETRAQTITTTAGGYTVPQGFMAELEKAQLYFGGALKFARQINTAGGNPIPWPTIDDTANSGEDKAINIAAAAQDLVFGQKTLKAWKIGSGLVLVPTELFEDTGLNLQSELADILGERLGRRRNNKYTVGVGTTDFQGFVVGATAGTAFASATAITADELIATQHMVDPAYRQNPKCCWQMNDDTIRYIRQLKDSYGRYLLDPAVQAGGLDTLLTKPLVTNNDMATIATGNKSVVFGDFSKFVVRNVRNIVVRRLDERYAEADQVAFLAWYRGDSQVISASTKALVSRAQA